MRWLSAREIELRYMHRQLDADVGILPTSKLAGQIYTRHGTRAWYETGLNVTFVIGVSCP